MAQRRIAVIPVVKSSRQKLVCLVTSRDHGQWILPTGKHEKHLSNRDVALLEAYEEAGLSGRLDNRFRKRLALSSPCGRKTRKTTLYLIRVDKQHKQWPEKSQRRRILVKPGQLHRYLADKKLRKLIKNQLSR